jgi:ribosomal protein L11 methylase PrmA
MLRDKIKKTPNFDIVLHENRSGHAVFHYRFTGGAGGDYTKALDRGVYKRNEADFHYRKIRYSMRTAFGLPEFDSLHYRTGLLLEGLEGIGGAGAKRAIVFNPGQGHVPVVLWKLLQPEKLVLIDRDLLALRYSAENLVNNGCPGANVGLFHQAGIKINTEEPADLIAGIPREEEGPEAAGLLLKQAAGQLSPGGIIILAGGSTAITRLVGMAQAEKQLKVKDRIKKRGYSRLALKQG